MEEALKENNFSFQDTTATQKVFSLTQRIRAVKGGTSASKTISILIWLIDYCQSHESGKEICTVVGESFPKLSLGAIRDFKAIMKDRGYWNEELWNATNHFYTFETGNMLEFYSVDNYAKAHGPRRDVLFLNECNYLSWNIVDQLITRTRKIVWLDWNPTEEFWFHEQMLPHRDDIDYIKLTYKDNEALDEVTIREIESHQHNVQWWNVYGLGNDGETESRVYPNWEIIDTVPEEARLVVKGLDFGYTNDPTCLADVYKYNDAYIVDELVYQKGLHNSDIAKIIGKTVLTIADSSEPKSIAEIAMYGVNIIGAKKGKGSISHGIDSVRSRRILVTKRSINIIKENRNYCYIIDKNGKITNDPNDVMNHAMDAVRYAIAHLHPEATEADEYVQPEHELPGLTQSKSATPLITVGKGTRKDLMERVMQGRKPSSDSFEQPDYERPGLR